MGQLRNVDPGVWRQLKAIYHDPSADGGSQGIPQASFSRICVLLGMVLRDMADSFPDGMAAVEVLCPSQNLRELQRCVSDMRRREAELWRAVVAEEKQRARLVFESGITGLTHVNSFAGFKFTLQQLVLEVTEIHALVNAALQTIPWAQLPQETATELVKTAA